MEGKALLKKYLDLRDNSGSEADEYALVLSNIMFNCPEFDIESALVKAEKSDKKIVIDYPEVVTSGNMLTEDISPDWISIR